MISPREKAEFVRALLALAPKVVASGVRGFGESDRSVPSKSGGWSVLRLLIPVQLGVVAIVLGVLYAGTRPPSVHWSADAVTIGGGLYSRTIHRAEVESVSLQDDLPTARRRAGFGAAGYQRGLFDVDTIGHATLFVQRGGSPYLFIRSGALPVIVNYKDPLQTHALHDEFKRRWALP